ncbi:MAG: hypothetical protein JWM74_3998 [Myxococcaceae bacterium]|nr:hypothetical protein [Myxococcaceae bacterium]
MTHANTALHGMLDRLHGAPLTEFVTLRKTLAAELKERGDKASADALLAVKKPPLTAWALNQVALHHHAEIEGFLAATEKLRAAQQRALGGDEASDFRESGRELQRQLNAVVALAKKSLDGAGHAATTTQLRRIGQSLHSTAFAAPSDLARLAAGHLEADLDVPVDFGVFAAPEEGVRRLAEEDEEDAAAKKKSGAHAKKSPKSTPKHAASAPAPAVAPAVDAKEQREAEKQRAAAEARAKKEEEKQALQNRAHQARELREARAEATALAKKAEAATKRAALLDKAAKIHERKAASARQAADHAAEAARIAEAAAGAAAERASSLRD